MVKPIYGLNDVFNLQSDMNNLFLWCNQKNMKINVQKTQHIRIKLGSSDFPLYHINGTSISKVDHYRHLGLIIDEKLTFNNHVDKLIIDINRKWSFLKKICPNVDGKVYLTLYRSYILPLIEYCNLAYFTNNTNTIAIEKIQKRISKFVCFKLKKPNLSYIERLKLLKLNSIYHRKLLKQMNLLKRIHDKSQFISINWHSKIRFQYNRQNNILIDLPFTRINKCDQDIFIVMSNNFNDLPSHVRNSIINDDFLKNVINHYGCDKSSVICPFGA
jgi:hypothetical protein